ncbi:MAG: hypothetical protein ACSLEW_05770 [Nocardioides sp.]
MTRLIWLLLSTALFAIVLTAATAAPATAPTGISGPGPAGSPNWFHAVPIWATFTS